MMRKLLSLLALWLSVPGLALSLLKLPPDDELYQAVKAKLAPQSEMIERIVRRVGNQTIEFEAFIACEGDMKIAPRIFSDYARYASWALRNINVNRTTGGNYYFQFLDFKLDRADDSLLNGFFLFNFPVFKQNLERAFRMGFEQGPRGFTVTGVALPKEESPISAAEGILRAYPAEERPGTAWFYVKAVAVLRSWILYEAMPNRLLHRESGERMKIVVENYIAEEDRVRSSQIPTGKTAARSPKPEPPRRRK